MCCLFVVRYINKVGMGGATKKAEGGDKKEMTKTHEKPTTKKNRRQTWGGDLTK